MIKNTFSILALALFPLLGLMAQTIPSSFSGDWDLQESGVRFRFENGNVVMLEKNESGFYKIATRGSEFQFQQSSMINRNNAQYTWINTCKECRWTETQSYLFSYINKYNMAAFKIRVVNNIGAVTNAFNSWHSDDPKSFANSFTYNLEPVALRKKANPTIGASSSRSLSILEVGIHEKFTVIKFELKNTSSYASDYTLNPPDSEKAFQIHDMRGRTYKLVDEFGFGGFGTITLGPTSSRVFHCYFEPIPLDTQTINIKEGNCSGELCWNFYEVSLK